MIIKRFLQRENYRGRYNVLLGLNCETIFVKYLIFIIIFINLKYILLAKFVNAMGFEGHVFDMIRRTKQNRKMLQDRRDRMKDLIKKINEKPLTGLLQICI